MNSLLNEQKHTVLVIVCSMLPLICSGQHRDKATAIDVAKAFCSIQMPSVKGVGLKIKGAKEIDGSKLSSQSKEAFYIFQGQGKGFVIVSGDERMPSILAYSDDSNFNTDSIPPSVKYWLKCYEECFINLNYNEPVPNTRLTAEIQPKGISPLLDKIQWGQGYPFNQQCPNVAGDLTLTGCVATAMAQVMKYYEYPQRGDGKCDYYTETNHVHIMRDLKMDEFKWGDMLPNYKQSFTNENANAVSTLMVSCGASVQMDYGTSSQGGSGAFQSALLAAYVDNYSYDPDAAVIARSYCSTNDWHDLLINELNEGRPVNYAGHSTRDGGHSFVIDGYRFRDNMKYPDYHVNWGWNGSCDGYYQIADLQPKENTQAATLDGFNSNQQMTIGIKPDDGIDERFVCLCTDRLKASESNCKPGDKFKVTTSSICNFGYHPFSGIISVNLINDSDTQIELNKTRQVSLNSLEDYKNFSIEVLLPNELKEGDYTLQLMYYDNYGNKSKIYSKSYPQIAVSSNGDTFVPPSYVSSTLGCSDVQFMNNRNDNSEIRVCVYEFINLEEAPFIGDVRLLIYDKEGLSYTALGDSVTISEIGQYEVLSDHITLKCKIIGEWPEGQYRICVGARPVGTTEYLPVSYYNYAEPSPVAMELYFDTIIKDKQIQIDNHKYDIIPNSIDGVFLKRKNKKMFSIDGKSYSNSSVRPHILIHNGLKLLQR